MNCLHAIKLLGSTLVMFCSAMTLHAAEVRGQVSLDYEGLFQAGSAAQTQSVSVALVPAAGQKIAPAAARKHRVEIVDNRMRPAFLTISAGDRIEFTNRDRVFHELFSLSSGEPLQARLDKVEGQRRPKAEFILANSGTTHFFCRIHNKSYARVDVVDTPYIQILQSGGEFHFVGLSSGRWRLRMAASAAETRWIDVTAMTRPGMLDLELISHAGSAGDRGDFAASEKVQDLYVQPDDGSR